MLVPSDRHTPRDLELWAELEEADRLNGERLLESGKVDRSIAAIREFLAIGQAYVSISFGKDSLALARLAIEAGFAGPLVHLRAIPHGNPENAAVRSAFLAAHPGVAYDERPVDYRDIPTGLGPDQVEREKDRRFYAAFPRGRHLSGIRADESSGRAIRMRRWGLASANACAPLGWWTAADVFAFLAIRGLPVHPSYAMLGGGLWDRRHVRVDELGGARGDQFGRREWEWSHYGDVLRRLDAGRV